MRYTGIIYNHYHVGTLNQSVMGNKSVPLSVKSYTKTHLRVSQRYH